MRVITKSGGVCTSGDGQGPSPLSTAPSGRLPQALPGAPPPSPDVWMRRGGAPTPQGIPLLLRIDPVPTPAAPLCLPPSPPGPVFPAQYPGRERARRRSMVGGEWRAGREKAARRTGEQHPARQPGRQHTRPGLASLTHSLCQQPPLREDYCQPGVQPPTLHHTPALCRPAGRRMARGARGHAGPPHTHTRTT